MPTKPPTCPHCGANHKPRAIFCTACGQRLPKPAPKRKLSNLHPLLFIAGAILLTTCFVCGSISLLRGPDTPDDPAPPTQAATQLPAASPAPSTSFPTAATLSPQPTPTPEPAPGSPGADQVIAYQPGPGANADYTDPQAALGEPDIVENPCCQGMVQLGRAGTITLAFTDNTIVNRDGPDFQIHGESAQDDYLLVQVSPDGQQWATYPQVSESPGPLDLADVGLASAVYIRLTDRQPATATGAELDAVIALHTAAGLGQDLPPIQPPEGTQATVTRVIDGDTIEVQIDGQPYTVRYIGIDTPELDDPGGPAASDINRELLAGKTVYLVKDVSETDQYDRLLRYVYRTDGTHVNAALVRRGYAIAKRYPPDTRHHDQLTQLMNQASAAHLGLWQPTPTPPPAPTQPPQPTGPPVAKVTIVDVNKKDEWVDIQNVGGAAQDLAGWRLVSEKGNQQCDLYGVIQPGQTVRVWAMTRNAGQGGINCGYGTDIWNNSQRDPAVLYNAQGQEVSRQ